MAWATAPIHSEHHPVLHISNSISLADNEIYWQAIRAQGAGGQHVNKVASAIHLRFDIGASSLPDHYKQRLLARSDQRVTADGVIVIKAQQFRSQDANLEDARTRLAALIRSAGVAPKNRKKTRPSRSARRKRMDKKTRRGRLKALRGKGMPRD